MMVHTGMPGKCGIKDALICDGHCKARQRISGKKSSAFSPCSQLPLFLVTYYSCIDPSFWSHSNPLLSFQTALRAHPFRQGGSTRPWTQQSGMSGNKFWFHPWRANLDIWYYLCDHHFSSVNGTWTRYRSTLLFGFSLSKYRNWTKSDPFLNKFPAVWPIATRSLKLRNRIVTSLIILTSLCIQDPYTFKFCLLSVK